MTYEGFMDLPFSKQLHACIILYCKANGKAAFRQSKPTPDYFKVRQYLWNLPRQNIKNIWKWINDKKQKCYLYKLDETAQRYIQDCQSEKERQKVREMGAKQHSIDDFLEDFLND